MPTRENEPLESQILSQFRANITESDEISEEVVEILDQLEDNDDFGGREQIEEKVLESRDLDED